MNNNLFILNPLLISSCFDCLLFRNMNTFNSTLCEPAFYNSESIFANNDSSKESKTFLDRYEIYDGDESTSFADATSIQVNTEYDFCHNFRHDIDYFVCNLSLGNVISFNCSEYSDINVYKKVGMNDFVAYFTYSISSSTTILINADGIYGFSVTSPGSYTGYYTFELLCANATINSFDSAYVHLIYDAYGIMSISVINFNDFTNLPSSGSKTGYCGSYGNTPFSFNYSGGQLLSTYANNHGLDYVLSTNGIFNSNNISTGSSDDDERKIFPYTSYLPSSTPFMISSCDYVPSYKNMATAFFVDDEYAFSAAHMVFDPTTTCFAKNIVLKTSKYPFNYSYSYDIQCVELYFPYAFLYYCSLNTNTNLQRLYDWCVMKLDLSDVQSAYIHSYLGISYPANCLLTYYNIGYPSYDYSIYTNEAYLDTELTRYRIPSGSSGLIYMDNNLIKTYIDLTSGHSGGPCLYKNENDIGFAVGIVSGNDGDGTGNIFTPINKYSFAILNKYLNEVI